MKQILFVRFGFFLAIGLLLLIMTIYRIFKEKKFNFFLAILIIFELLLIIYSFALIN